MPRLDNCREIRDTTATSTECVGKRMKVRAAIMLKTGVLDPQGEAIRHALGTLGFVGVEGVRQGKIIEIDLAETDAKKAEAEVQRMCEALLANTVIESYKVELP